MSRLLRVVVAVAGICLLFWIAFLDSHSLLRRASLYSELRTVRHDNESLHSEIDRLETELDRGLTDSTVERIAREQYNLQRPGETVHPTRVKR